MEQFFQEPPSLENQYNDDRVLRQYLSWKLPAALLKELEPDLINMGQRTISDIYQLGIEAELNPPIHIPYDAWGRRIDQIKTSEAWQKLDSIAAEEKLVAIGYQREQGVHSRIYQFAKLYLFHPSSAMYTCPLAMSDGAARTLEIFGDEHLQQRALPHLTSIFPSEFWTSGQWMTEKTGGSDISLTNTIAIPKDDYFELHGDKWFTSATTSQMAMTLARIEGDPAGSKGLSLFYLELKDEKNKLNNIRINRLKNKLGTHALPTAELTLAGTKAFLVGDRLGGIKKISTLFNITRIYNACCAVSYMRRGLALARSYATKRKVFGHYLSEQPLHLETLSHLQLEFEAAFYLTFKTIELLGKSELEEITMTEKAVLRLLTPIVKLYTAKKCIEVMSEIIEAFGGAGYIEDTGLPKLLRDAQVLSIWEGTTNVLSLDALRALDKDNVADPFFTDLRTRVDQIRSTDLKSSKEKVSNAIAQLINYNQSMINWSDAIKQTGARHFAFSIAKVYAASLLLESAEWHINQKKSPEIITATANRWCSQSLIELIDPTESYQNQSRLIAMQK